MSENKDKTSPPVKPAAKSTIGRDISDGLKKMSEEDWDNAMKKAAASEDRRSERIAKAIEDEGKKKDDTDGGPEREPAGP